jgi:hypothetical protein
MRVPNSREKLNALRAELDAVWLAPTFDQHATARIYAAMMTKLNQSRPPGYVSPHDRHFIAGRLARRARR